MRTLLTVAVTVVALAGTGWPQTPRTTSAPDSRFAERFRQADANGDGVITIDEARAANLWFKRDFDSVDTDRSNTVTLFEFGEALQQRLSRWLSDFDAADANHDGQVTEDEAARAPTLADVFTTIDHRKDHAVSRQQYESYAIERLSRDSELPSVVPNIFEKRF
jgi:Ca2+-binding EF-hand superfamily protein